VLSNTSPLILQSTQSVQNSTALQTSNTCVPAPPSSTYRSLSQSKASPFVIHSNARTMSALGTLARLQSLTPTYGVFKNQFKFILAPVSLIWVTAMSMKSLFQLKSYPKSALILSLLQKQFKTISKMNTALKSAIIKHIAPKNMH
jgi:hypothetical protein